MMRTEGDDVRRETTASPKPERGRGRQAIVRVLLTAAIAVLASAVVLFVFGTPQSSPGDADSPSPPSGKISVADGSGAPDYRPGAADPEAEAPTADPASPLAIEIPGCVCHSDDPKVVEEHSHYRMNQCAGCHIGGVKTGR